MCPSGVKPQPSAALLSDFRPAFDVLDTDRDGKISRDDLRTFYSSKSNAAAATDEDIGSMISAADSNKDGFVQFDEFKEVLDYCPVPTEENGNVMEDVFRAMDRDGDGKVGFEDLKGYMNWAGFEASDEDVKAMIKLGGGDDSDGGGVCYQDLLNILTAHFQGPN